jgi:hypothetical protein
MAAVTNRNVSTAPGAELRRAVQQLWQARDAISRAKALSQQLITGLGTGNPDFMLFETVFDIAPGQGQALYNLIANADRGLTGIDVTDLITRVIP